MTKEHVTTTQIKCPVCSSVEISIFVGIPQVPVHCNLLWPTHESAKHALKADIRLGFCSYCGHIYNYAFNPAKVHYDQHYENSLHFSSRFQEYARSLALRLIQRHNLYCRDIIEIGCGSGEFLGLLCRLGGNRGVGFDPIHILKRYSPGANEEITFIRESYSDRHASHEADLICCRHVLEHIQFPREFLHTVRRAIGSRLSTVVFFEVPNVMSTLKDLAIWDLIYEHCSYFSMVSLTKVFSHSGFKVCQTTEEFEGQFLCIEALPERAPAASQHNRSDGLLDRMLDDVQVFAERYWGKVKSWESQFDRIDLSKRRSVVWGAGSKGVTFLNTLSIEKHIDYVVDINPHKQGKYVAGTGQRIVPPQFLKEYRPDLVIVMNPIYFEEIQQIMKQMNLSAHLVSV